MTKIIEHIEKSIQNAIQEKSKLPKEILDLSGMSDNNVRRFLNNVCTFPEIEYTLEVGTHNGSTFFSSLYENKHIKEAISLDNHSTCSEIYDPNLFPTRLKKFSQNLPNLKYYDIDAFSDKVKDIIKNPIQFYFYDGDHSEKGQELALTKFEQFFGDCVIYIVDDYKRNEIKNGTKNGLEKIQYTVEKSWILNKNNYGIKFWSDLAVFLLRK